MLREIEVNGDTNTSMQPYNGTITIKFQIGKYWKSKSIKLGIVFLFLLINVATNELQALDVLLTNNVNVAQCATNSHNRP